jgi:hypothetical protein
MGTEYSASAGLRPSELGKVLRQPAAPPTQKQQGGTSTSAKLTVSVDVAAAMFSSARSVASALKSRKRKQTTQIATNTTTSSTSLTEETNLAGGSNNPLVDEFLVDLNGGMSAPGASLVEQTRTESSLKVLSSESDAQPQCVEFDIWPRGKSVRSAEELQRVSRGRRKIRLVFSAVSKQAPTSLFGGLFAALLFAGTQSDEEAPPKSPELDLPTLQRIAAQIAAQAALYGRSPPRAAVEEKSIIQFISPAEALKLARDPFAIRRQCHFPCDTLDNTEIVTPCYCWYLARYVAATLALTQEVGDKPEKSRMETLR